MNRLLVLGFLVILSGCGSSRRTVGDLVQHFRSSGLQGEYSPSFPGLHGSKEAGTFRGEGFTLKLLLFDDESRAVSLEKSGIGQNPCHRNGRFVLVAYEGEDKVLPVFRRF